MSDNWRVEAGIVFLPDVQPLLLSNITHSDTNTLMVMGLYSDKKSLSFPNLKSQIQEAQNLKYPDLSTFVRISGNIHQLIVDTFGMKRKCLFS